MSIKKAFKYLKLLFYPENVTSLFEKKSFRNSFCNFFLFLFFLYLKSPISFPLEIPFIFVLKGPNPRNCS